jgi:hypothetical protein
VHTVHRRERPLRAGLDVTGMPAPPTAGRAEGGLVVAATVAVGLGGLLPQMSTVANAAAAATVFGGLLLAAATPDCALARPLALYGALAGLLAVVAPRGPGRCRPFSHSESCLRLHLTNAAPGWLVAAPTVRRGF